MDRFGRKTLLIDQKVIDRTTTEWNCNYLTSLYRSVVRSPL